MNWDKTILSHLGIVEQTLKSLTQHQAKVFALANAERQYATYKAASNNHAGHETGSRMFRKSLDELWAALKQSPSLNKNAATLAAIIPDESAATDITGAVAHYIVIFYQEFIESLLQSDVQTACFSLAQKNLDIIDMFHSELHDSPKNTAADSVLEAALTQEIEQQKTDLKLVSDQTENIDILHVRQTSHNNDFCKTLWPLVLDA